MSLVRTVGRNIISNWAGFFVHALVTLFLTPYVLHQLGDTRYGVWALVISITGYYGILDLGLRSGLTQYITRYLAKEDYDQLNRAASSGFFVLAGCGALIAFASVIIAFFSSALFNLEPDVVDEVAWCIIIIAGGAAVQFIFFPFAAVFTATQRYDLANAIGITTRLLTALVIYLCLQSGYGLVALSLATAGSNIFDYLLRWQIAKRILPQLHISSQLVNRKSCREVFSYGFWAFLGQSSNQIADSSVVVIIGVLMPAAAIGRYALAATIVVFYRNFLGPTARVFFPITTSMDARNDEAALKRVYLTGTRLLLLLSILIGFEGFFFADEFFALWIGPEHVADAHGSIPTLFRVLLLASGISASQYIGNQVFLGRRQVVLLASCSIGYTVNHLILCATMAYFFGLIGVVAAVAGNAAIFHGFIMPYLICKSLSISLGQYVRSVCLRPTALAFLLIQFHWLKDLFFSIPSGWLQLIANGVITFIPVCVLGLSIVLTKEERAFVMNKSGRLLWAR